MSIYMYINQPKILELHFIKKNESFSQKENKRSSLIKIKCNSDSVNSILSDMPEAFVSDKKRPAFSSLPVLQRIGRLDLLKKKDEFDYNQKIFCNEINHEFRFLSLKKSVVLSDNPLLIKLGVKREEDLLFIQEKNKNPSRIAKSSSPISYKTPIDQNMKLATTELTLSKIFYKKLNYSRRLLFIFVLFFLSYLSII